MFSVPMPQQINVAVLVVVVVVFYVGKIVLEYTVRAFLDCVSKAINPKREELEAITRAEFELKEQARNRDMIDLTEKIDHLSSELSGLRRLLVASLTSNGKSLTPEDLKDLGVP